ncbi:hypothetical protein [Marinicella sp. W31]|uniref:hypothetical protein n=1 Tax=Marinicella sp. W31 TaxID=3023713 RepID=UPI003756B36D
MESTQLDLLGKRVLRERFYLAITEFFYDLEIGGQDTVNQFIFHYINEVFKKTNSKGSTSYETGFSRHIINKFLNDYSGKPSSENNYYKSMIIELDKLAKKNKNAMIPIKGKYGSFNWLFYNVVPNTNNDLGAQALLQSLEKRGFLKKIDDESIQFITTMPTEIDNTPDEVIFIFCQLVDRVTGTLRHNLKATNRDETRYQTSFRSNKIHPNNHKACTDKIRERLRKCFADCIDIVESFEETEDFFVKQVEHLNQEVGFTMFIFNNEIRE